jgi:hypothetical protein
MSKGIDCTTTITSSIANALVNAGYSFVCRYMVPESLSWKRLTVSEAEVLTEAGLNVLCVYETSANRAAGGEENGRTDGIKALKEANILGMPTYGCIYFAVDYDAGSSDFDAIEAYLRAAKEQIGEYKIGVYGGYDVITAMAERGTCDCYWQTYAWSRGKQSDSNTVYQYKNDQTVAGIAVDLNEAYSDDGFWNYNIKANKPEPEQEQEPEPKEEPTGNNPSNWAEDATAWMIEQGLSKGDGNGNFDWQKPLTREAFVVMLKRYHDGLNK